MMLRRLRLGTNSSVPSSKIGYEEETMRSILFWLIGIPIPIIIIVWLLTGHA